MPLIKGKSRAVIMLPAPLRSRSSSPHARSVVYSAIVVGGALCLSAHARILNGGRSKCLQLLRVSGKLMRTIMAGLAEFERDLIKERVKSGLAAAKTRGVVLGPRPRASAS